MQMLDVQCGVGKGMYAFTAAQVSASSHVERYASTLSSAVEQYRAVQSFSGTNEFVTTHWSADVGSGKDF